MVPSADGRLSLRWIEAGGPTATPPTHRGFGTRIMENMIGQLRGEMRFDWRGQGLTCEIALPLYRPGSPKVVLAAHNFRQIFPLLGAIVGFLGTVASAAAQKYLN